MKLIVVVEIVQINILLSPVIYMQSLTKESVLYIGYVAGLL